MMRLPVSPQETITIEIHVTQTAGRDINWMQNHASAGACPTDGID